MKRLPGIFSTRGSQFTWQRFSRCQGHFSCVRCGPRREPSFALSGKDDSLRRSVHIMYSVYSKNMKYIGTFSQSFRFDYIRTILDLKELCHSLFFCQKVVYRTYLDRMKPLYTPREGPSLRGGVFPTAKRALFLYAMWAKERAFLRIVSEERLSSVKICVL